VARDRRRGAALARHKRFLQRLVFNFGDEVFGDLKMNVGFQQGQPNLTESIIDISLRDTAMTPEVLEDVLKFIGKLREHDYVPLAAACLPAAGADGSTVKFHRVSIFLPFTFAVKMTVYVFGTKFCVNS
jgi:hypothetical protein